MKWITALLLLTSSSIVMAQTAQEPTPITVTMGDDGAVEVPLEFSFPLYDQLFTTSWMYDNGIISFLAPGTPGVVSPWQWSAQSVDTAGNYYIASLWADIAPNSTTKYTYQGNEFQMKYTWSNIAEYYSAWSPQPRYNTFSTTIKSDGMIETHYSSLNLQTSAVSAGVVGNRSLGEIQSYYWSPCCTSINSITDWTYVGNYVSPPPPPPPPPEPDPYIPPEPPAPPPVVEEPIIYDPIPTQQEIAQAPVPVEVLQAATTVSEPVVQQAAQQIVIAPSPTIVEPTAQQASQQITTATSSLTSSSSEKKLVQIDAQSIARNNQKSLAALTDSIVSSSIQGSIEAGSKSAENSTVSSTSSVSSTSTKVGEQIILATTDNTVQTQAQTQASSTSIDSSKSVTSSISTNTTQSKTQGSKGGESGIDQSTVQSASSTETQTSVQVSAKTVESALVNNTNSVSSQDSIAQVAANSTQQDSYQSLATSDYSTLFQAPAIIDTKEEEVSTTTTPAQSLEDTLAMFRPYTGATDSMIDTQAEYNSISVEDPMLITSNTIDTPSQIVTDDINPTSIRSLANAVTAMRMIEEEPQPKQSKDELSDNDPVLVELAESGPKLEAIQVVPIGYFNYLNLAYRDVPFYKDRVIYRKQKPVDNLRILRLLNARNDITYNKMLEGQYTLEDM